MELGVGTCNYGSMYSMYVCTRVQYSIMILVYGA